MNNRFYRFRGPLSAPADCPRPAFRIAFSLFHICCFACLFAWQLPAQSPVAPLPPLDSLTEAQVVEKAQAFLNTAADQRNLAELQLHNAQSLRTTEEARLAILKADTLATKEQLLVLDKNLKSARNAEKVAEKNARQAEKNLGLTTSVQTMDSLARRKSLTKVQRQLTDMQRLLVPPPVVAEPPAAVAEPTAADTATARLPVAEVAKKEKKPDAGVKKYKTYTPQSDVTLYPPAPPCALVMDRRDEFSGEIRRETARTELFRSTNAVLKNYLQGNIHILCEAALSTAGQTASLMLTFTVRDPNVRKSFGNLPKNGLANLRTLDGTTFTVYNQQLSEGIPDETGQVYTFRGQYPLDKVAFKKLRSTGLDKLRIAWATGYEDYEVQQVDLLMQQAQCLER